MTRFSQLPLEISTKILAPFALPGEPFVILRLMAVGNLSAFRMGGRTSRVFRFDYSRAEGCHLLRVPLHLWQMDKLALAREALDQRLMHSLIVDVELPSAETEDWKTEDGRLEPGRTVPEMEGARAEAEAVVETETAETTGPEVPQGGGEPERTVRRGRPRGTARVKTDVPVETAGDR